MSAPIKQSLLNLSLYDDAIDELTNILVEKNIWLDQEDELIRKTHHEICNYIISILQVGTPTTKQRSAIATIIDEIHSSDPINSPVAEKNLDVKNFKSQKIGLTFLQNIVYFLKKLFRPSSLSVAKINKKGLIENINQVFNSHKLYEFETKKTIENSQIESSSQEYPLQESTVLSEINNRDVAANKITSLFKINKAKINLHTLKKEHDEEQDLNASLSSSNSIGINEVEDASEPEKVSEVPVVSETIVVPELPVVPAPPVMPLPTIVPATPVVSNTPKPDESVTSAPNTTQLNPILGLGKMAMLLQKVRKDIPREAFNKQVYLIATMHRAVKATRSEILSKKEEALSKIMEPQTKLESALNALEKRLKPLSSSSAELTLDTQKGNNSIHPLLKEIALIEQNTQNACPDVITLKKLTQNYLSLLTQHELNLEAGKKIEAYIESIKALEPSDVKEQLLSDAEDRRNHLKQTTEEQAVVIKDHLALQIGPLVNSIDQQIEQIESNAPGLRSRLAESATGAIEKTTHNELQGLYTALYIKLKLAENIQSLLNSANAVLNHHEQNEFTTLDVKALIHSALKQEVQSYLDGKKEDIDALQQDIANLKEKLNIAPTIKTDEMMLNEESVQPVLQVERPSTHEQVSARDQFAQKLEKSHIQYLAKEKKMHEHIQKEIEKTTIAIDKAKEALGKAQEDKAQAPVIDIEPERTAYENASLVVQYLTNKGAEKPAEVRQKYLKDLKLVQQKADLDSDLTIKASLDVLQKQQEDTIAMMTFLKQANSANTEKVKQVLTGDNTEARAQAFVEQVKYFQEQLKNIKNHYQILSTFLEKDRRAEDERLDDVISDTETKIERSSQSLKRILAHDTEMNEVVKKALEDMVAATPEMVSNEALDKAKGLEKEAQIVFKKREKEKNAPNKAVRAHKKKLISLQANVHALQHGYLTLATTYDFTQQQEGQDRERFPLTFSPKAIINKINDVMRGLFGFNRLTLNSSHTAIAESKPIPVSFRENNQLLTMEIDTTLSSPLSRLVKQWENLQMLSQNIIPNKEAFLKELGEIQGQLKTLQYQLEDFFSPSKFKHYKELFSQPELLELLKLAKFLTPSFTALGSENYSQDKLMRSSKTQFEAYCLVAGINPYDEALLNLDSALGKDIHYFRSCAQLLGENHLLSVMDSTQQAKALTSTDLEPAPYNQIDNKEARPIEGLERVFNTQWMNFMPLKSIQPLAKEKKIKRSKNKVDAKAESSESEPTLDQNILIMLTRAKRKISSELSNLFNLKPFSEDVTTFKQCLEGGVKDGVTKKAVTETVKSIIDEYFATKLSTHLSDDESMNELKKALKAQGKSEEAIQKFVLDFEASRKAHFKPEYEYPAIARQCLIDFFGENTQDFAKLESEIKANVGASQQEILTEMLTSRRKLLMGNVSESYDSDSDYESDEDTSLESSISLLDDEGSRYVKGTLPSQSFFQKLKSTESTSPDVLSTPSSP